MQINNINTQDIELTQEIRDYLQKKVDSLDKFVPKGETAVNCDVELAKTNDYDSKGQIYYAEINLEIAGNKYRATNYERSLHSAIDRIKEEVSTELRKGKSKRDDEKKKKGAKLKEVMHGFTEKFRGK